MAEIDCCVPIVIPILDDIYAVIASQEGRKLAAQLGFSVIAQTSISTAILEIARNIVKYAGQGEVILDVENVASRIAIVITARDNGPGIPDLSLALKDGYSSGKSLGLGLPGARRLVDEFEIITGVNQGTTVIMKKGKA